MMIAGAIEAWKQQKSEWWWDPDTYEMVYFRKGLKEKDSERRGSGNTWLIGTEEVNGGT